VNGPASTQRLRVAIVVPVWNGERTIARCIESLVAQTYPAELTSVIVVDNGSDDATCAVAAQYPVMLLHETALRTSYAARNRGVAHTDADVVAFIDADCMAHPGWIEQLVAPLADDAVGAVAGLVDDAAPASLAEEFTARLKPFDPPVRRGLQSVVTANLAVRRQALLDLGCFDERLPTAGDVDFGWRLQQQLRLRVVTAPDARVQHRHRSTFREVFRQFERYGLSEVLLSTLYDGRAGSHTSMEQLRRMCSQVRALASYAAGFALRVGRSLVRGFDRRVVLWPLFLFAAESGNMAGKIRGLIATRYYRRNPYANPRIVR
jgi:glycosyltransferase involved in cell wall biosynthesis